MRLLLRSCVPGPLRTVKITRSPHLPWNSTSLSISLQHLTTFGPGLWKSQQPKAASASRPCGFRPTIGRIARSYFL